MNIYKIGNKNLIVFDDRFEYILNRSRYPSDENNICVWRVGGDYKTGEGGIVEIKDIKKIINNK